MPDRIAANDQRNSIALQRSAHTLVLQHHDIVVMDRSEPPRYLHSTPASVTAFYDETLDADSVIPRFTRLAALLSRRLQR
ncbi:hypothetical protein PCAR4_570202 [Paraburkholderia caribensis]|nr:hypothetical protein PCAR4_570202 [Paraburkholderia caribensis]